MQARGLHCIGRMRELLSGLFFILSLIHSELQNKVMKAKLKISQEHYKRLDPFVNDRLTVWGQLTAATVYGLYLSFENESLPVDSIFSQTMIEWIRSPEALLKLFREDSPAMIHAEAVENTAREGVRSESSSKNKKPTLSSVSL